MHSLLIIAHRAGDSIEDLMEPYWQDLEVEEYCDGEVSDWDKERFLEFYGERDGKGYKESDFDSLYEKKGEDWNFNRWRKGPDGVWREYSTSNPDMRWDWYEIGGRWAGRLELKDGAEPLAPLHFSWGWSEEQKREVIEATPRRADSAYLKDVANLDTLMAADIMLNGEWITLSDFEFVPVGERLGDLPGDTVITCVDYHM